MSEGKETGKKRRSTLRLIAVCGIMANNPKSVPQKTVIATLLYNVTFFILQ